MPGISSLSIIPVRKEPSDPSEMVTQILFGETFDVLETRENWSHIRLHYDDYTGWADSKQITFIDEKEVKEIYSRPMVVALDLVNLAILDPEITTIVCGSSLPHFRNKRFHIGPAEYEYEELSKTISGPDYEGLMEYAYQYHNAPYLWGGRSPFGIDCSGFTQMVFKMCGIRLKRDAHQQALQGSPVDSLSEVYEGDLAFFKNSEGRIVHTGIIEDENHIIHASGKVRIDRIDEKGIFNEEKGAYTHSLASIRRMF